MPTLIRDEPALATWLEATSKVLSACRCDLNTSMSALSSLGGERPIVVHTLTIA